MCHEIGHGTQFCAARLGSGRLRRAPTMAAPVAREIFSCFSPRSRRRHESARTINHSSANLPSPRVTRTMGCGTAPAVTCRGGPRLASPTRTRRAQPRRARQGRSFALVTADTRATIAATSLSCPVVNDSRMLAPVPWLKLGHLNLYSTSAARRAQPHAPRAPPVAFPHLSRGVQCA